jgi:hypothetical protein
MGEYERELERVNKARADFEASQDEVERRKQDYFTAVRTLHEAGMPLREIATALGLSHQRVHQMVEEATGKHAGLRRKAARAAKQGGLALLVFLLGAAGAYTLGYETPLPNEKVAATDAPSPSRSDRDGHRGIRFKAPGMGTECAMAIFERYDRATGGRDVTYKIRPRCMIIEVRKRTS